MENNTILKSNSLLGNEQPIQFISKSDYKKELLKYLESSDFNLNKKEILRYIIFIACYLFALKLLTITDNVLIKFIESLGAGLALAGLTFFLHDLIHDGIVKSPVRQYIIGLSIGIFNLFPPLFWERLHKYHHARTGMEDDPDRNCTFNEKPESWQEIFLYKLRISTESHNNALSFLFISFGFISYFATNIYYGFFNQGTSLKEAIKYKNIQTLFQTPISKAIVIAELVVIFSFQFFLFAYVAKYNLLNFFFISLLPILMAHFITMVYIHTNHIISPLTGEVDDTLINSVSIKNSRFVDLLFSNFSHHVEHHLFPSMSSSKYPKIRTLLQELYPSRYQLLTMKDALMHLFNTPRMYFDSFNFTNLQANKMYLCRLPKEEIN